MTPFQEESMGIKMNLEPRSDATTSPVALNCSLCPQDVHDSSILYGRARQDGLGEEVGALLFYLQTAHSSGVAFGGLVQASSEYPFYLHKKISSVLGLDYRKLLVNVPGKPLPAFDSCFAPVPQCGLSSSPVPEILNGTAPGEAVLLTCRALVVQSIDWGQKLTPEFLTQLRATSKISTLAARHFDSKQFSVAMHLRRGDVVPGDVLKPVKERQAHVMNVRYVEDEVYLTLIHQIRRILPEAQIHIFSTTGPVWPSASFDLFRGLANLSVHLDGDELEDLAHLAKADLLIGAPSSFSFVAQLFNQNCVVSWGPIFQDGGGAGLPQWIDYQGAVTEHFRDQLRKCLRL